MLTETELSHYRRGNSGRQVLDGIGARSCTSGRQDTEDPKADVPHHGADGGAGRPLERALGLINGHAPMVRTSRLGTSRSLS